MDDSAVIDLKQKIEKFFTFFHNLVSNAKDIKCDHSHLFSNSMCYLIIDTLSKAVFPKLKSNSERVIKFIKQFGNWPDGERLSLPSIYRLIEIIPDSFSKELIDLIKSKMANYRVHYSIKDDPFISEINQLWPNDLPEPYIKFKRITLFQHWSFFYSYRNDLMHELKMSGEGHIQGSNDPYYYLTCIGSTFKSKKYYRLFYPPVFLTNLVSNCLDSTKRYFEENNKNPYDSFDYGIFIFQELNNYA